MKIKNKIKLPIILIMLGVISQSGIAYASRAMINVSEPIETNLKTDAGEIVNGISGIDLSCTQKLSVGKYFYYDYVNNSHSSTADLVYNFKIIPANLPQDFKIASGNGGYEFSLYANLSLGEVPLFAKNTYGDGIYVDSIKFNKVEMENPGFEGSDLILTINIETKGTGEEVETFSLNVTFNQKLILEHRNDIINQSFLMELTR